MRYFYSAIFLLFSTIVWSQSREISIPEFLSYRNMAPHRAGSWISSIAIPETDNQAYKYTYYIGSRNGGVWKTINNGTTFFPVFDSVGISSIGSVAVSSSNPDIVYVGTGEAYNARSSHAGKGVFKSSDAGVNWSFVGLEDTHHISSVIVHPDNPDIVWVAAMGHLFTPNENRGVFKSTDGGSTWVKVLYIDENTGVIDLIISPDNPSQLYAAAYEKYRYPWHYEAGGINSGIYITADGGDNWNKIQGGLPKGKIGRIGLGICHSKPDIIYAVIENLNPKDGVVVDKNIKMNYMRDPYFDQLIGGEVYRSNDGGIHWAKQNQDSCNVSAKAAYSFNKILVNPDNPDKIFISSDMLLSSEDGGRTWNDCSWPPTNLFLNMFGDIRTFWIDPKEGNHIMIGSDGGLYESFDGGLTVNHLYQIPLGEIYMVETDNTYPYNIYVGLQDHEAWKAPSNSWSGQIGPEDWDIVGMWDGMYTIVDPEDNRWVYISTQFGAHHRIDQLVGERTGIEPKSANKEIQYRFPWTPPIEISSHDSEVIYAGSQFLLKSSDRGDNWEEISPDLTTNDEEKIAGRGHMMYCTITTISESPLSKDIIWVGTDDGRIHLTKDGGNSWEDFTDQINTSGGKEDYWVSRVVASGYDKGVAYVCKSGFRKDDFSPLVYMTSDFGETWNQITEGLPDAPVNVIIEDPNNDNILYLGNDLGVYITFNKGKLWQTFQQNMPIVPVKDLKIQEEENDLVAGTYGRGAYIIDVSLLHQLLESEPVGNKLFNIEPKPVRNYSERSRWGNYEMTGDNHLFTSNEPNGWEIYYKINIKSEEETYIIVLDAAGIELNTFSVNNSIGIHHVVYDTHDLKSGYYRIKLKQGDQLIEQNAVLKPAPVWPVGHGFSK